MEQNDFMNCPAQRVVGKRRTFMCKITIAMTIFNVFIKVTQNKKLLYGYSIEIHYRLFTTFDLKYQKNFHRMSLKCIHHNKAIMTWVMLLDPKNMGGMLIGPSCRTVVSQFHVSPVRL